jgi:dynein heavy chain 1
MSDLNDFQSLDGNMTLKPIVHEIRIQNQVIFLDPPIEHARANWVKQLHDWLGRPPCRYFSGIRLT